MSKQPLKGKEEDQKTKMVKDDLNIYNSIRRLPCTA